MGLMMEFCPLGSLDAFVRRELDRQYRKQDFTWFVLIRRFLAEVLLALNFLHTKMNVVYRDLKLENVLVVRGEDEKLHVKIADFGFGKILERRSRELSTSITGTAYWMSPEMGSHMRSGKKFRMSTREQQAQDMYQFGTLVFRLAYGSPTPMAPVEQHCTPSFLIPSFKSNEANEANEAGPNLDASHETCQSHFQADVHPCCVGFQADTVAEGFRHGPCTCPACHALAELESRFESSSGSSKLVDVIRRCVSWDPRQRPSTEDLMNHALFVDAIRDDGSDFIDFNDTIREEPAIDFAALLETKFDSVYHI